MISQYKHNLIISKTSKSFKLNLLVSFGNWIKFTLLLIKSWLYFSTSKCVIKISRLNFFLDILSNFCLKQWWFNSNKMFDWELYLKFIKKWKEKYSNNCSYIMSQFFGKKFPQAIDASIKTWYNWVLWRTMLAIVSTRKVRVSR